MGQIDQNLLFTIIAASVAAFLGFLVFLHSRKSVSSIIFIIHSFVGVVWAVTNYFSLISSTESALFWIRGVIFWAVSYVFLFFLFIANFPSEKFKIRRTSFLLVIVLMAATQLFALSPYVFESLVITPQMVQPVPGKYAPLFGLILAAFLITSVVIVVRNYIRTKKSDYLKYQWLSIGFGLLLAYALLIFFVFFRVAVLNDTTYVVYSPLFTLPIFFGAAFAILRLQLFNIKVIATEIFVFLLMLASFTGILIAGTLFARLLATAVTIAVLFVGIFLIRSVLREVKQREKLAEQAMILEKQTKELEKLSAFKTQLLSFASHQLKAPMAVIKGYSSILLEGMYGPVKGKVKETIVKMKESTDELIGLVNTLLDLRRIDEGKMEYEFTEVELGGLINHVVEGVRQLADKKKLELKFTGLDHPVKIKADGTKLSQVIGNLVENAIKYTPEGSVHVSMREEGEHVIVSVKDTGLGISPTLLGHLFEEFTRDDRVKKEIRGTGLGLYIARKMVEAHNGEIWAESEGEGKGSTFSVKLKKL